MVRTFAHGAMGRPTDPSWIGKSYFTFQPVFHDWCNKGCCMCYPVCGMVYIKDPLLLIGKSCPCSGGIGFPLSLSEWSFTICPTPYNRINVLSASLNETFPSFYNDIMFYICLLRYILKDVFQCRAV